MPEQANKSLTAHDWEKGGGIRQRELSEALRREALSCLYLHHNEQLTSAGLSGNRDRHRQIRTCLALSRFTRPAQTGTDRTNPLGLSTSVPVALSRGCMVSSNSAAALLGTAAAFDARDPHAYIMRQLILAKSDLRRGIATRVAPLRARILQEIPTPRIGPMRSLG